MLYSGMKITFATINTGHVTLIKNSDVMIEVVDILRPMIESGGGPVPSIDGYSFQMSRQPDNENFVCFSVEKTGLPSLTMNFVCDGDYRNVWDNFILPFCANTSVEPRVKFIGEPFLATIILPGSILDPASGEWLGDFEKCVAWTMLKK